MCNSRRRTTHKSVHRPPEFDRQAISKVRPIAVNGLCGFLGLGEDNHPVRGQLDYDTVKRFRNRTIQTRRASQ